MLTLETQKRVASLFECIAENERQVEVVRQVLSEQDDFDPLSLFSKLSDGKSYIIRKDITDFLDNYSVRYLPQEMNQLYYNYNASKEKMNYTNFLKMILPNSSHFLRQLKVELIPHRRKVIDVTYELEWALIRVFEKELQLYRVIEVQKEEIVSRWDFKISAAFRCISQKSSKTYIEHGDLQNFIDLMNCSSTSDDILNILRRCDHDKDGKISQLDLELSLTPYKKYKASLIQQSQQLQQQEKKPNMNGSHQNLANSAIYNHNSSTKKKVANPQQAGSAQKDKYPVNGSQQLLTIQDQPKSKQSRSFSYQNNYANNYPNQHQGEHQGSTSRSNQKYTEDNYENMNRTPVKQNSQEKFKQHGQISRNSARKGQNSLLQSQEINQNRVNENNSNDNHITPTKNKNIQYTNNQNRCNSSNNTTASQGFSGSQSKQSSQTVSKNNSQYNQNYDQVANRNSVSAVCSKKTYGNQYENRIGSNSGVKQNQNQQVNSKITSKLNKSTNETNNINNSFLNYKEELKNQIRNEIIAQQQQKKNPSQNYNDSNKSNHDNYQQSSYNDDQKYRLSNFDQTQLSNSFSISSPPNKVLTPISNNQSNVHKNSQQGRYENSNSKRYGDIKQKIVDELNTSLVLSEKNSPTRQIYKKLKENLYSNHKSSSINYEDASAERKNAYGREFKQKLREELSRSGQGKKYGNNNDDSLNHTKYVDSNATLNSPSPVRIIKVDVKDIYPLKQNNQLTNQSNNRYSQSSQPTEKKQSTPQIEQNYYNKPSLNNTVKEGAYSGPLNNHDDDDLNASQKYYPTAKKEFMKTQVLNRESLSGPDSFYQQKNLSEYSYEKVIPSPVRTSYQDNMKEYYLEKNKRQQAEEELEQQMKYKQQQKRTSSHSPYNNQEDLLFRNQSIRDQQIIDKLEQSNQMRNIELKKIKEIEEQQIRELELIKQKQFLMEEDRISRLKKEETIRKKQIEEELLRREKMRKQQEEIERFEQLKREKEIMLEQEKIQLSVKERIRIDEELRMKQLRSKQLERDVKQLEQQLARQSSIEREKQYNQKEDIRREQEIQYKQKELENTRREYEQQVRASLESTQYNPNQTNYSERQFNNNIGRGSIDHNPPIQLYPVPVTVTTPQHLSYQLYANGQQPTLVPVSNSQLLKQQKEEQLEAEMKLKQEQEYQQLLKQEQLKQEQLEKEQQYKQEREYQLQQQLKQEREYQQQQQQIKQEREFQLKQERERQLIQQKQEREQQLKQEAADKEAKQKVAREIEEKRKQLELETQRALEIKLQQEKEKQKIFQQNYDETMNIEKKRQELILVEEIQKKKLQEIEIERYKNEKLREIEEQENQRIFALEKNLCNDNIHSPSRTQDFLNKSLNRSQYTPNQSSLLNKSSNLNKSMNGASLSPLEDHVISIFKFIIESSNDIQNIKENISMRADFTLSDAFRSMDVNQKGYIDQQSFEQYLTGIDVHSSRESITLLFSKICPRNQKFLNKEDVDKLYIPLSSDHCNILANRFSLYNPRFPDFGKFSFETKDIISNLFKKMISSEQQLEQLKQDLLHSGGFKLEDAYFLLDKEKNGQITHDELKKVLDSYHVISVGKDIKNIFSRFDYFQRGKITFEDFRQEILPFANYN